MARGPLHGAARWSCCWPDPKSSFYGLLQSCKSMLTHSRGQLSRKWNLVSSWVWGLSRHRFSILSDLRVVEPARFIGEPSVSLRGPWALYHISFRHYLKENPSQRGADAVGRSSPGQVRQEDGKFQASLGNLEIFQNEGRNRTKQTTQSIRAGTELWESICVACTSPVMDPLITGTGASAPRVSGHVTAIWVKVLQ